MALLDATHARRMALIEEESKVVLEFEGNEPESVVACLAAEQAERDARTPAQWARREYMLNKAPRCTAATLYGRHRERGCNENRWRVIDMFCRS